MYVSDVIIVMSVFIACPFHRELILLLYDISIRRTSVITMPSYVFIEIILFHGCIRKVSQLTLFLCIQRNDNWLFESIYVKDREEGRLVTFRKAMRKSVALVK